MLLSFSMLGAGKGALRGIYFPGSSWNNLLQSSEQKKKV